MAAEIFDDVTIMFSDLSGFAEFVAVQPALAATLVIGCLESVFETAMAGLDVRKVEAITDSFMVSEAFDLEQLVCTKNGFFFFLVPPDLERSADQE